MKSNTEAFKNYYARYICRYNFMEVTPENVARVRKEFLDNIDLLKTYCINHPMPDKDITDAYKNGQEAYKNRTAKRNQNPYPKGNALTTAWEMGWDDAQEIESTHWVSDSIFSNV